jgi:uncharacterized SAM-binding protein YcdF (DUF218 family)
MTATHDGVSARDWRDGRTIWHYLKLGHALRPCTVGIGLGGYDLAVAARAAELYHQGLFPLLVFSGATSPLTVNRYPQGEAVHFRNHAVTLGVPPEAICVEPHATNTGENIIFSRALLAQAGVAVQSALLISKPFMERRALATAHRQWPGVEFVCTSPTHDYCSYASELRDRPLLLSILVGTMHRIIAYPDRGFAEVQAVPPSVRRSVCRLRLAGYGSDLPEKI